MAPKIQQICPSCFSARVHVRIGASGGYKEDGIYKTPDDFGEVFSCPDCRFQGVGILEGNGSLVEFLRTKKLDAKRQAKVQAHALEQKSIELLGIEAKA